MVYVCPTMLDHLKRALDVHLLTLSGGVVTLGSILIAVAILFSSTLIGNVGGRGLRRMLKRRGLPQGTQFAASKIFGYVTLAIGTMVAFDSMGIRLDALIATSAVVAVGIGFGLQNIAQNFISGLILLVEQPVRKGDFVRVGDALGVVDDIGLRATRIITRDAVAIIVPNSGLVTEKVINHSRPTSNLRVRVPVGVAYGTDTHRVRDILLAVTAKTPGTLASPPPEVRFEAFGASSLDFALLLWIPDPRADLKIASDLRFAIEAAFREAAIEMPFPQTDVHVRSGLEAFVAKTERGSVAS
jgi:potassium-dependent mechanosensitive channel